MLPCEHFYLWVKLGSGRAAFVARELNVSKQYINQIYKGIDVISTKRHQEILNLMIKREQLESLELKRVRDNVKKCQKKLDEIKQRCRDVGTDKEEFVAAEFFKWRRIERELMQSKNPLNFS